MMNVVNIIPAEQYLHCEQTAMLVLCHVHIILFSFSTLNSASACSAQVKAATQFSSHLTLYRPLSFQLFFQLFNPIHSSYTHF